MADIKQTQPKQPVSNTRTVKGVFETYVNLTGLTLTGVRGEVVEVHPDDLDRFDRLQNELT